MDNYGYLQKPMQKYKHQTIHGFWIGKYNVRPMDGFLGAFCLFYGANLTTALLGFLFVGSL